VCVCVCVLSVYARGCVSRGLVVVGCCFLSVHYFNVNEVHTG